MRMVTVNDIIELGLCDDYTEQVVSDLWDNSESLSLIQISELEIPVNDRIWALVRLVSHRTAVLFAADCAEMCLPNANEVDRDVLVTAIEASRSAANGGFTDELRSAAESARYAAESAARSAESAARSAESAGSAAGSAARSAARSAGSAARSAGSAAESAVRSAWYAAESAVRSAWSAGSAGSAGSAISAAWSAGFATESAGLDMLRALIMEHENA